jgi:hypothetical protein
MNNKKGFFTQTKYSIIGKHHQSLNQGKDRKARENVKLGLEIF